MTGYKQKKISKKKSDEYVTINIYDHEVTWDVSASDSSISLSAAMACRSISLIISTFEGVLVPRKHSSMLLIKAKFSLAFIHALIVLLGSFLLLAKRSAVCEKKRLHSLLILPKHENTSGLNDPCST